ncbi:2-succinylbenzoate--CoA ligase, chloroplastic/peroxisomal isoform X2 [Benincasa hispida]|uniref:2-succinylbenzoate--CoA ligase, chloroplastic/peroxisomal isoform X2 n=1 Tax=Benincasa hispida TaxID=102211 RepID=UPI0019006A54|nr:2-succinylbenzoate--CoA ligase, chloroplastic/peroxisomal isoform X2 [Benincasa hispida]
MTNYSLPHICQCLTRIATARRASPLTVAGNRRQTGQQFVDSVFALARGLLDLGLLPGHVVVISAFNSDWYLEWLLAVTFVGGIAAPLNYRWSFEEAISAIVSVQPVMLVTDESCCQWYSKLQNDHIPSLRWHVLIGSHLPGYEKTRGALSSEELKKHYVINIPPNFLHAAEGVALICFTSGTTGRPKGVAITHSALIMQALAKVAIVGYSEDDVYLHTAPLCHIGGLSSAIAMLMLGARHILIPKFEVKSAVEAIDLYGVTSLITVPAMMADLVSLIRERDSGKTRESVKKILNGGGGLPLELIKDAVKIFPRAKLVSAYGMTETCSSLTFLMLSDPMGETSIPHFQSYEHSKCHSVYQPEGVCVGKPAPHIEIKICLDGSSHVGRILTRGPHLMLRYYDKISARPSNDVNEVWFDTGDIGSIDDSGNLWLVGRSNGRIKSGGENIYPEEGHSSTSYTNIDSSCEVDYTNEFTTNEIFKSREALINWTREVGKRKGLVIVIKTSDAGVNGRRPRISFGCERSGSYRRISKLEVLGEKRARKLTGTKKCGCPFLLKGQKLTTDDDWMVKVVCGIHNHLANKNMEGHTFAGRLSQEENEILMNLSNSSVRPKDILSTLKSRDARNASTMKTIYNARHRQKRVEKKRKPDMQQLFGGENSIATSRS